MTLDEMTALLKAQAWEEAKGKLRAIGVMTGHHAPSDRLTERWERITDAVETFISEFESEGFHE